MSALREPVPFEEFKEGVYLHGTKADLGVGDLVAPGRESNFEAGRVMNYVYFSATLDAAVWGPELAIGDGRGRISIVEPTGEFEDDPNLTDKKFPGNPTRSFRSREPLRVVASLSTGSVTRPRRPRTCEPQWMKCSGTERPSSRIRSARHRLPGAG
jgi:rifampin ADP-ribosylating transferase